MNPATTFKETKPNLEIRSRSLWLLIFLRRLLSFTQKIWSLENIICYALVHENIFAYAPIHITVESGMDCFLKEVLHYHARYFVCKVSLYCIDCLFDHLNTFFYLSGDYGSAIETLVTAISLIKQSKVASDERAKVLIGSLQDCLHGIEEKSFGSGGAG